MEVILLENINKLGVLGDKVSVQPGYGRNFLIPTGKAVPATTKSIAEFEARRAELEKQAAAQLKTAQKRADAITKLTLELKVKTSDEGKLYGSIGTQEIANAITEAGVELKKSEVRLPTGALHYTGEYDIDVQLHTNLITTIKLTIVSE